MILGSRRQAGDGRSVKDSAGVVENLKRILFFTRVVAVVAPSSYDELDIRCVAHDEIF